RWYAGGPIPVLREWTRGHGGWRGLWLEDPGGARRRGDVSCRGHQAVLCPCRKRDRGQGEGEPARRLRVLAEQPFALRAVHSMARHLALELGPLLLVEAAQHVRGDELLDAIVWERARAHDSSPGWTSIDRRRRIPRSVRLLTVPRGSP